MTGGDDTGVDFSIGNGEGDRVSRGKRGRPRLC